MTFLKASSWGYDICLFPVIDFDKEGMTFASWGLREILLRSTDLYFQHQIVSFFPY